MKNLLFVVMLWSTIVGALPSLGRENCTNAIVKWCGTVQNSDYLEIITRGHEHNRGIARAHARLAEGDFRYIRYAISVQGRMPSIDNLGFLYTFTNSPQYAAQAASSIIRMLRAIRNPITLVGDVNGYYVPEANKWIGFDMKHGGWVLSGHKGNTSDFEVFLEWDGRPTQDSKLLKLHFRSIEPKGGFYYADVTKESSFRGVYTASTNDVLQRAFSCQSTQKEGRIVKVGLPHSKLLVLRSRCVCNQEGVLMEANYSAINWIAVEGTRKGNVEMLLAYAFNPTPNDTNLEPK